MYITVEKIYKVMYKKTMSTFNILVVAGEQSGDKHAASIIKKLKKKCNLNLFGTGGSELYALGQVQQAHVDDMAVIGFDGVIEKLPSLITLSKSLLEVIEKEKIDIVLLVDYAGFNLRFAPKVKKRFPSVKVVGLIAPQVWIWNYRRVKVLEKYYDKVLCILPFEEKLLIDAGVNAVYIGNPVVSSISFKYEDKQHFLKANNLNSVENENLPLAGLIPGSRIKEVESLLPLMLKAAEKLKGKYRFAIGAAKGQAGELVRKLSVKAGIPVLEDATYDVMKYSDVLWICSGTATLEAAILQTPMIILYQSGWLNFKIMMNLTKLRMVGLPNIIYEKMWGVEGENKAMFPELLWKELTVDNLLKANKTVMENLQFYREKLEKISEQFVNQTPDEKGADEIYYLLSYNLQGKADS